MPSASWGGHYQAAGHAAFLSGVADLEWTYKEAWMHRAAFAADGVLDIEPSVA